MTLRHRRMLLLAALGACSGDDPDATATLEPAIQAGYVPRCEGLAHDAIAWLGGHTHPFGDEVRLFRDGDIVAIANLPTPSCSVALVADGGVVFEQVGGLVRHSNGTASSQQATDIVAADPGGGVLVFDSDAVVRLTAALAVDPAFGTAGRRLVAAPPAQRLVQGPAAAPFLTARIGTRLERFDLRTGAAIAAFGGDGGIDLAVAPDDVLALAPQPADGIAVISRGPAASQITIHRLDATGASAAPQVVALDGVPADAGADDAGRVTLSFPGPDGARHLARIVAATGELDPTFATGGRATVIAPIPTCNTSLVSSDWRWAGVRGDGVVAFAFWYECSPISGHSYWVYHGGYHLYTG